MLKILMMMRPNALTQRGGDTVVLERLTEELKKLGHEVTIELEGNSDPANYDITHLYNFATEKVTEALARRCVERGAKFVVTTLYEDWPLFFNSMIVQELILTGYVKFGQPREHWEKFRHSANLVKNAGIQDNTFAAEAAQILISSGYNESVSLRQDYPRAGNIEICKFGSQVTDFSDGGEKFRKYIRVDEYILCVGRLEQRKNQLTLLKALEDSPMTVVFMTGGFTYEATYEAACRKFGRKGRNIFLGRLSPELLASAYDGAKAHVLPSYYELPGLVSIEAAARGTPVVVTDYGTIRDYLGDGAHYCEPGNPENILQTIERAIAAGPNLKLKEEARTLTWERTASRMVELYEQAISMETSVPSLSGSTERNLMTRGSAEDLKELENYPMLGNLIQDRLKARI